MDEVFSITTSVFLLRKIGQQGERLFLISALFLIIWGASDTFGLQSHKWIEVPLPLGKNKRKKKVIILTKCLGNSVRTYSCSYVETLDECKILLHGLTLQCLHVCPESSTLFGFVAHIHCLCWTFCTHTLITVLLCLTHRCKTSLISNNHLVHATWHIHTQPCPGEIEKPSSYGSEPLRKYWLSDNQIGIKLVLELKKINKIGLSAAIEVLW